MNENHINIRETFQWGTYGKLGDQPLKLVLVKDITDDHLEHLIPYLQRRYDYYQRFDYYLRYDPYLDIHQGNDSTLLIMLDEKEYRNINHIKIPFVFGR